MEAVEREQLLAAADKVVYPDPVLPANTGVMTVAMYEDRITIGIKVVLRPVLDSVTIVITR